MYNKINIVTLTHQTGCQICYMYKVPAGYEELARGLDPVGNSEIF